MLPGKTLLLSSMDQVEPDQYGFSLNRETSDCTNPHMSLPLQSVLVLVIATPHLDLSDEKCKTKEGPPAGN